MSRYSAVDKVTGEWGEIVWSRQELYHGQYRYLVYVGGRGVGEVWPGPRNKREWMAISYAQKHELLGLRSVDGFATRWAATQYLLDIGVRPPTRYWSDES